MAETVWINMGPQHPMTHGLWNLRIKVDGDTIVDADPEMGYLHRGVEKLCEVRDYLKPIVLMDRLCYVSSLTWAHVYCKAVENLMDIEPPPRGKYLNVIGCELQRMASHGMWLAAFLADLGLLTGFLYSLRERELVLDLLQLMTGQRMNQNYPRPGGVHNDIPPGFEDEAHRVFRYLRRQYKDYEKFLEDSPTFLMRTQGLGILKKEDALNYGVTGPNLRGSGARVDLRELDPYDVYDELDFEPVVYEEGDALARYKVRMGEFFESMRLIEQALDRLPEGPYRLKTPKRAEGEGYARTEDPRGEALIYIIGDGSDRPYRVKIRSPIFVTLSALPMMLRGHRIADVVSVTGSIDVCVGEIDK
ncbi:MAG: NADH-quinone oxidoreductase subunit D [Thermoplasmata archaeon]